MVWVHGGVTMLKEHSRGLGACSFQGRRFTHSQGVELTLPRTLGRQPFYTVPYDCLPKQTTSLVGISFFCI